MRELSLFTGAGGGLLGTHLLGWGAVGYVEWNEYCQRVIAQRIADGILPAAPIFTDVREFVQSGAAREYRGFADVVTAGFPCQPFSVAGKQKGADDERNMWPATIATIRAVRPRYCLLENVPGLVTSGYFGTILGQLAESGYDCRWRILSAAELGAPHRRDRLWIVASDSCEIRRDTRRPQQPLQGHRTHGASWNIQHPNAISQRTQGCGQQTLCGESGLPWGESLRGLEDIKRRPDIPEPLIRRMDDGFPNRVDRLRAAGNAQVPLCAAMAFLLLVGGES